MNKNLSFAFALLSTLYVSAQCAQDYVIKVGNQVTISLPANHTTGYSWRVKNDETDAISSEESNRASTIKYSSTYKEQLHKEGIVGVGGNEEWSFTAYKPGNVQIQLEYVRPWEKNPVAADQRTLNFRIGTMGR